MSTIVTRALGGYDNFDRQAIRVDANNYRDLTTGFGKWGIIEIVLTSYAVAGSGTLAGHIDLRSPNYNVETDDILVNNVAIPSSPGTVPITKKVYIAVNAGVPGPSVLVNPDGTWDLLWLTYTQTPNNAQTNTVVTVTYTLSAFLDLTTTVNPANTSTFSLAIDNVKTSARNYIGVAASSLTGQNGRILAQINTLAITTIDRPVPLVTDFAPLPIERPEDYVPFFEVINAKTETNVFTGQGVLASHPVSKLAGTKTYYQCYMIFAVNTGKVDGNGRNFAMSNSQALMLCCTLYKDPSWPCDDTVTGVVGYTATFTAM